MKWGSIRDVAAQKEISEALAGLVGTTIHYLKLPKSAASQIEPSQVGTLVGTLTDMMLPTIALERDIGLKKADGLLGDREGYPDFLHSSGYRLELKGVFQDNPEIGLESPPTAREPSARLTQKVTVKNVRPDEDGLLLVLYKLDVDPHNEDLISPKIVSVGIFPVYDCILARDKRMTDAGGLWFGDYETPTILSRKGKLALKEGRPIISNAYGRKESEGHHFNEDTNFGKLKRIPYPPLQTFLKDNGCI